VLSTVIALIADERQEERSSKHIDVNLLQKAIFTEDVEERNYYMLKIMRKGKQLPNTNEDLFLPYKYRMLT